MIPGLQRNRRIVFLIKLSISLGLVAYLIWLIDWGQARMTLNEAHRLLLLAAPFLLLGKTCFAAWRMQIILADNSIVFSYWQAFSAYLVGSFYGIFLPGVIGGDAIRIARCTIHTHCRLGTVTASVLLERLCGIFTLLGLSFFIYLFYPAAMLPILTVKGAFSVQVLAVIGSIVILGVLFGRRFLLRFLPQQKRTQWLSSFIFSGLETLGVLKTPTLGIVLLLSLLFQITDIIITFLLSQALHLEIPLLIFFAVIPLVYFVTILPISLGGLGIREGTFVVLLAQYGVMASDAVMLSFLIYISRVMVGILGGILQLMELFSQKQIDDKPIDKKNFSGIP